MTESNTDPEGLWDVNDTAAYLKVNHMTVRRMVNENRLPYLRIGKLLRFEPALVRDWVAGKSISPVR